MELNVVEHVDRCEDCRVPLKFHPVMFGCDEWEGYFCNDCWNKPDRAAVCEEQHGEGCVTMVFNCAMDNSK